MRRFIYRAVGILTVVAVVPAAAQETLLDHYGTGPARLRALCAESHPGDQRALLQRHRDLEDQVRRVGADDSLWRSYGCVLALLYADSREDAHPVPATRFALPAVEAFLQVLERHPADAIASSGLATLGFELTQGPDIVAALRYADAFASASYAAVHAGVTTPIVLRMCTEFTFVMLNSATARYCNHRALSLGADSTWQLIRSAWFSYLEGDKALGASLFDRAIATARDSAQAGEVIWRVRRMVDEQAAAPGVVTAAWAGLSDSARVAWVHDHVAKAAGTSGPSYTDELQRTEGRIADRDPIFLFCPLEVIHNGASSHVDRRACDATGSRATIRVGLEAAMQKLWDPETGQSIGLLTYALARHKLVVNGAQAPVRLSFRQWEWEKARWTDTTLQVRLEVPNELPTPLYVAHLMTLPAPEGTYSWTLATQQPGRSGWALYDQSQAPRDSALALSDLILGVPGQKLSWKLKSDTIVLAPWNSIPPHKPFELYYQLRNDGAVARFTTRLILRKISHDNGNIDSEPELSIAFPVDARTGITGVHRQISLAMAEGTDHNVEVQILDRNGHVVLRRSVNLLVR